MSENNGVLGRDAFFAACKSRAVVAVEVPDWGKVNVRKLTLGQLRAFDEAKDNYERAKMLILHSIVDGQQQPIFKSIEEVDMLEMPLFKALSDAVTDVNALKVTDDSTKNLDPAKTSVLN